MRFSGVGSSACQGLRQRELDVNGVRITYTEAGEGPPVLMLHGAVFAGNVFWWETQVALARHARTIAPDFPGWGESDRPLTSYTLEFYHRFLDDFLDALGLDRVTIVAHSMGGLIGSAYALTHPHRVAGLATVGVPPVWVDVAIPELFQPFLRPVIGEAMLMATPLLGIEHPWGIRRYYESLFHDVQAVGVERLKQVLRQGCEVTADPYLRQAFLSTMRANQAHFTPGKSAHYRECLREAAFPIMMVAGTQDPLFPLELFHAAAAYHPAARLEALDPCGHFPMWEHPERVAELLQAFIPADRPVLA
ncbi:MAG TPA: alpha/beta hydrolase [Stenomitos sp.]